MSVIAIRYKNFMAFQDTGWLELRPICLLFGRNSSGKSAIIRGLRLLKQSLRTEENGNVKDNNALRFAVEGQLDLGDFRSALHQHTESANDDEELEAQKITFAFRIETPDLAASLWQRIRKFDPLDRIEVSQLPSYIELNLEFGLSHGNKIDVVRLVGVHLDCPSTIEPDSQRVVFISAVRAGELDQAGIHNTIWSDRWYWASDCGIGELQESNTADIEMDWEAVEIVRRFGFLPHLQHRDMLRATENLEEAATDYALVEFALRSISVEISSFLQNIQHLGPMRPKLERVYMLDRFEMDHWRAQGLGAWLGFVTTPLEAVGNSDEQTVSNSSRSHQLVESADEKYELPDSTIQKDTEETEEILPESFPEQVSEWIKRLHLGSSIQVDSAEIYRVGGYVAQVFIVKENGKLDNLVDVGYGASQVLPIIVTCLRAKPGSLIIVEQPELHLHPSAQAELGDLFIQTIAQIEESEKGDETKTKTRKSSGRQVLIETHSEHLLLRLRRRVAESTTRKLLPTDKLYLNSNELHATHIERETDLSIARTIEISPWGELLNPIEFKNFFADDVKEVAALARARLSPHRESNK